MRILASILFAAVCLAADPESAPLPRNILTNDGLVILARAGLGDSLLVDLIRHKRTQFDTSADGLALLARQGLSEGVLRAVVEKQEQVQMRKPQIAVTPVGPGAAGAVEVAPGEVLLVPPAPAKNREPAGASRWYKVFLR